MRLAVIGFDSAWGGKRPGAICGAVFQDGVVVEFITPLLASFSEAANLVERFRGTADVSLLAIDQPTIVPNETRSRPAERVLGSLVGRFRGGVQPANRSKPMFGSDGPIWPFLARLAPSEDPVAARSAQTGLHLVEVFPAPALLTLAPETFRRRESAKYKPGKGNFSLVDWHLVTKAVQRYAREFGISALADWAKRQGGLDRPRAGDQDCLDAAICMLIGLWWRSERHESMLAGDTLNGYIVVPAGDDVRAILEPNATETRVPWVAIPPDCEPVLSDITASVSRQELLDAGLARFQSDRDAWFKWLNKRNDQLGGATPLDRANEHAEGTREVINLLLGENSS